MNKTVDTKLAIAIIVIVALIAGGVIFILFSNNSVVQTPNQAASQPTLKNNQQSTPQANKEKVHIAYTCEVGGKNHVIYDGRDMGETAVDYLPTVFGDNIVFQRETNSKTHETHIIYNGNDIGKGYYPEINGNKLSYLQDISGKPHLMFNGEDFGEVKREKDDSGSFDFSITKSGDNVALERDVNGKTHVFFNKKDLGEGSGMALNDENNLAFVKIVSGKNHIIYNGQDMGEGDNFVLGENSIAFDRTINGIDHVIYNGKDMGEGMGIAQVTDKDIFFTRPENQNSDKGFLYKNDQNLGKFPLALGFHYDKGNYVFEDANVNGNIIFNGKNLGVADGYGGSYLDLSGSNVVFTRQVDNKTHIIFNGKDLGEGIEPSISGNNIAFTVEIQLKKHIVYNGKDVGEGNNPLVKKDTLAFSRDVSGQTHIIFNNKDLGECINGGPISDSIYVSEN